MSLEINTCHSSMVINGALSPIVVASYHLPYTEPCVVYSCGVDNLYNFILVPTIQARQNRTLKYSIKIFNARYTGGSTVVEWESEEFGNLKNMRDTLLSDLKDHLTDVQYLLGYFEPGHSFKGKQMPLTSNEELINMYSVHRNRRSVHLWVKPQQCLSKRPRSDDTEIRAAKRSSSYDSHLQKMDDLEEILDKLKSKHKESKYTPEQLHCWANLIQMKKHDSYAAPPNKPFFGKQPQVSREISSPGKRIQLRTQCIDQLTKWHKLLEDQVISSDEYAEMHKTILSDIKKF